MTCASSDSSAPSELPAGAPDAGAGWRARLELAFERRDDTTALAYCRHQGPLVVQRPFYPEGGVCHVYVLHPPGGVVAGDDLALTAQVGPGAHALLTTPAAGKFYRSEGCTAHFRQELSADGGTLEFLPQESIYYPGASVQQTTAVELRAGARLFLWDIACFGLPARTQPFETGAVRLRLDIRSEGRYLLAENQLFEPAVIAAAWGLAGQAAVGTLAAYPAGEPELALARSVTGRGAMLAASLVDGLLLCRAAAPRADRVREAFTDVWHVVRPLMPGRVAVPPRVWAT